jgi:hypothetical protein
MDFEFPSPSVRGISELLTALVQCFVLRIVLVLDHLRDYDARLAKTGDAINMPVRQPLRRVAGNANDLIDAQVSTEKILHLGPL